MHHAPIPADASSEPYATVASLPSTSVVLATRSPAPAPCIPVATPGAPVVTVDATARPATVHQQEVGQLVPRKGRCWRNVRQDRHDANEVQRLLRSLQSRHPAAPPLGIPPPSPPELPCKNFKSLEFCVSNTALSPSLATAAAAATLTAAPASARGAATGVPVTR
eukprot:scaffold1047_cov54-Phaeocystis_antarctica.AAC.4